MEATGFLKDVTLSIAYDPAGIPGGVSESEMSIYVLQNGNVAQVPGCTVDLARHVVTGVSLGPGNRIFRSSSSMEDLIDYASFGIGKIYPHILDPGTTTSFVTTSVLNSNDCAVIPAYPLTTQKVSISADGGQITFMGFAGPWYGASGEGVMQQTIPIDVVNGCSVTQTFRFYIWFTDPDHFTAKLSVSNRYTSRCEAEDCQYEFGLTGVTP